MEGLSRRGCARTNNAAIACCRLAIQPATSVFASYDFRLTYPSDAARRRRLACAAATRATGTRYGEHET